MQNASHTIREELRAILLFLGAIWAVFGLSCAFHSLNEYGLAPRTAWGLIGIPSMVFLHDNFRHIIGNTVPLFVLLALLAGSKARSWEIVLYVILLGGALLWIFGRAANHGHPIVHIGASGLIFGLIAFLILSGFLEKRFAPLMISILVCFMYGGTLLSGVIPHANSNVSWDGHLCGAVAGGLVAYYLTKESPPMKSLKADDPTSATVHAPERRGDDA